MLPFNSLKKLLGQEKNLANILTEEMIDSSLRPQDDSGSSHHEQSTEFDTEEKIDSAKSNEMIEFIQSPKSFKRPCERERSYI